ncbi:xaa-Pro aminopeptidase 3-like [Ctenocephalides felis]|uniref:xaa-Pro aminopeptidase 3-like n=1 Tax=Ctenocephalides felis TaxID=7515 RepID=UPI000E6E446A|nr:xaa-Pro aminopeptidase 3-like [Ctenocephalides felis]
MFAKLLNCQGATVRALWHQHAGLKTSSLRFERTTHNPTTASTNAAAGLGSLTAGAAETASPSPLQPTPPIAFPPPSPIQGKPELIPGIALTEFEERRYRLLDLIRSASDVRSKDSINYIVVLASSAMKFSADRTPYSFRQNTDFLYMTGCQEPDCALVILMLSGRMRSIMFLQPKDQPIPQWGGVQAGVEGAPMAYGVDEAYPYSHITSYLSGLLKSERRFSMWFDERECEHPGTAKVLDEARRNHSTALFRSPAAHVQKMRLVKSPAEIAIIRRACEITGKAFNNTIAASRPGMNERAIHARIDAECLKLGAKRLAYPPVVAGGARANRIHYTDNNRQIAKGDLVLMDAG